MNNADLVEAVANEIHYLQWKSPRDPKVLAAMSNVDRKEFLPDVDLQMGVVEVGLLAMIEPTFNSFVELNEHPEKIQQIGEEEYSHLISKLLSGLGRILNSTAIVPGNLKQMAYADKPLSIGEEQTCSQPSLVGVITDLLELEPGMKVLEVGTGCGYHAAIVSYVLGCGKVWTVEYLDALGRLGKNNLEAHFGKEACERLFKFGLRDGSLGWPEEAPFDRIYLTAGINPETFNPEILSKQLKPDGKLMFPEQRGPLTVQEFCGGELLRETKYDGVAFVPLKGKNS